MLNAIRTWLEMCVTDYYGRWGWALKISLGKCYSAPVETCGNRWQHVTTHTRTKSSNETPQQMKKMKIMKMIK